MDDKIGFFLLADFPFIPVQQMLPDFLRHRFLCLVLAGNAFRQDVIREHLIGEEALHKEADIGDESVIVQAFLVQLLVQGVADDVDNLPHELGISLLPQIPCCRSS